MIGILCRSLFDHANNIFGGPSVPFDGENTCISYDAVNTAFTQAANRVNNHFRHQTMQTCKTLFLRLVCAQFMGNLRSATLEIWALLSMRRAGPLASFVTPSLLLLTFVPEFCIFYFILCRFLAKQYGLTKDQIANGLPLIDTTATLVARYCPSFLMTPQCDIQR